MDHIGDTKHDTKHDTKNEKNEKRRDILHSICLGKNIIKSTPENIYNSHILSICVMNDLIILGRAAGNIHIRNIYNDDIRILDVDLPILSVFVKDGLIVSASHLRRAEIYIWDITKPIGKEFIQSVSVQESTNSAICIKGNLIISSRQHDNKIRICDLSKCINNIYYPIYDQCVRILRGHTMPVKSICLLDNLIISSSEDNTIRIWDMSLPIGKECIRILNCNDTIMAICIIDRLIIASFQNKVSVWDVTRPIGKECIHIIEDHTSPVFAVHVKDNLIISGSKNLHITPITLFPGEYELFTMIISNYIQLDHYLVDEILGYF